MAVRSYVAIRQARPEDAEAMAHLHVDVWEDAYSALMPTNVFEQRRATVSDRITNWRQHLTDSPARTTVAEDANGLVGFASVGPPRADHAHITQELWALYVRASRWGTGVGHALLTSALADRPAYLWVLRENERAIGFYRKHAFVEDGATRADEFGTELRMVRPG